jgi:hypothetical protein
MREKLRESYEIPLASWDVSAWEQKPDASGVHAVESPRVRSSEDVELVRPSDGVPVHWDPVTGWETGAGDPPPTAPTDALGTVRELVAELRQDRARLRSDPSATGRDRASVASALASATRLLAKVDGSAEITTPMILRSRQWREVMVLVAETLRPWPDALAALETALEAAHS